MYFALCKISLLLGLHIANSFKHEAIWLFSVIDDFILCFELFYTVFGKERVIHLKIIQSLAFLKLCCASLRSDVVWNWLLYMILQYPYSTGFYGGDCQKKNNRFEHPDGLLSAHITHVAKPAMAISGIFSYSMPWFLSNFLWYHTVKMQFREVWYSEILLLPE